MRFKARRVDGGVLSVTFTCLSKALAYGGREAVRSDAGASLQP